MDSILIREVTLQTGSIVYASIGWYAMYQHLPEQLDCVCIKLHTSAMCAEHLVLLRQPMLSGCLDGKDNSTHTISAHPHN